MRAVDEVAQVVGAAIEVRWREQADAVVAPAERARELRDRHDLQDRDAERRELVQVRLGGRIVPSGVNVPMCNSYRTGHAMTSGASPSSCHAYAAGSIDFRQAVRALRLRPRGRVGIDLGVVAEQEAVAAARVARHFGRKVAVGFARSGQSRPSIRTETLAWRAPRRARGPRSGDDVGADGEASRGATHGALDDGGRRRTRPWLPLRQGPCLSGRCRVE